MMESTRPATNHRFNRASRESISARTVVGSAADFDGGVAAHAVRPATSSREATRMAAPVVGVGAIDESLNMRRPATGATASLLRANVGYAVSAVTPHTPIDI